MQKHNLSSFESENVDILDKLSSCKKLSKKEKKLNKGIHETIVILDCKSLDQQKMFVIDMIQYNRDSSVVTFLGLPMWGRVPKA